MTDPTPYPTSNSVPAATPVESSRLAQTESDPVYGEASLPALTHTEIDTRPASPTRNKATGVKKSKASSTWIALILGALVLIVLLIFVAQNQQSVQLTFFSWHFEFPAGVGFLLAAIAGALIMAMVGIVRMLELRSQVKKAQRS